MKAGEPNSLIVVVDDDDDVRFIVTTALETQDFQVLALNEFNKSVATLDSLDAQLVILDIELGHLSGLSILEDLRSRSDLPVILLTSRSDEADRVRGLDLGADDYVIKPFLSRELVSRVRAVLRRRKPNEVMDHHDLVFHGFTIDVRKREVTAGSKLVPLTRLEFDLLLDWRLRQMRFSLEIACYKRFGILKASGKTLKQLPNTSAAYARSCKPQAMRIVTWSRCAVPAIALNRRQS